MLTLLVLTGAVAGEICDLKSDEEIVFFPAIGYLPAGTTNWTIEVRGCVFEPEKRPAAMATLLAALRWNGVRVTASERAVLHDRARLFMVDNERGKRIVVRAGGRTFRLGKSGRDGIFSGVIQLPIIDAKRVTTIRSQEPVEHVQIEAVLSSKDSRRFCGTVWLFADQGVTVISDIDDTIKETSIRNRRAMLRSSFLEPFKPVCGMAELYTGWSITHGAQFCYVSASPWQLYAPLCEFLISNGFPAGSFSLKQVRWKDKTLLDLFADPVAYKTGAIEPMLERFPRRQFVLVGDSGERDPEIYAALARRYPEQITRILIRDVTDEPADSPRYREAFRDLPSRLWRTFRDPATLGPESMK